MRRERILPYTTNLHVLLIVNLSLISLSKDGREHGWSECDLPPALEDTPMLLIFGRRTHSISLPPLATSLAERAKAYMLLTLDEASQIQSSRSFANSS